MKFNPVATLDTTMIDDLRKVALEMQKEILDPTLPLIGGIVAFLVAAIVSDSKARIDRKSRRVSYVKGRSL